MDFFNGYNLEIANQKQDCLRRQALEDALATEQEPVKEPTTSYRHSPRWVLASLILLTILLIVLAFI